MHLIEGFADGDPALFQLHLHQRQPVDENGDIVAISLRAGLLKLRNDLHLVARDLLLIYQINILNAPVVKNKIVDVIVVDLTGFIDEAITRFVQIFFRKTRPFRIRKSYVVESLELGAHVGEHGGGCGQCTEVFVAVVLQVLDKFAFQTRFGLVVSRWVL